MPYGNAADRRWMSLMAVRVLRPENVSIRSSGAAFSFFFFFCSAVSWRLPDTEERPTGHRKRGHREKSGGRETSARRSSTVGFFSVPWFNGNVVDNDYGVSRSRSRPLKRKPFAGNPVRRIRAGSIFQIEIISLGPD